jgi:hypothetical protein
VGPEAELCDSYDTVGIRGGRGEEECKEEEKGLDRTANKTNGILDQDSRVVVFYNG